jgi:hypothetical protein
MRHQRMCGDPGEQVEIDGATYFCDEAGLVLGEMELRRSGKEEEGGAKWGPR